MQYTKQCQRGLLHTSHWHISLQIFAEHFINSFLYNPLSHKKDSIYKHVIKHYQLSHKKKHLKVIVIKIGLQVFIYTEVKKNICI